MADLKCKCGAAIPDRMVSFRNTDHRCRAVAICPACGTRHAQTFAGRIKTKGFAKEVLSPIIRKS